MPNQPMGYAAFDLGLGDSGLGTMLQDQVAGETEEQRKRRMKEMQQRNMMGGLAGSSLAVQSLFGSSFTGGGIGGGTR